MFKKLASNLGPRAADLDELIASCKPKSASASRDATRVVVTPSPTPTATVPAADADQLIADARHAMQIGQFAKALKLAEAALKLKGHDETASSIAAMAACKLKDRERALKHAKPLSGQRLSVAKQICLQSGIDLDNAASGGDAADAVADAVLTIKSNYDSGVIYLDGEPVGSLRGGSAVLRGLTRGRHSLAIEAPGAKSWELRVFLEQGANTVDAELSPE
jgi:hypothetical protein